MIEFGDWFHLGIRDWYDVQFRRRRRNRPQRVREVCRSVLDHPGAGLVGRAAPPPRSYIDSIGEAAPKQAGIGPGEVDVAEGSHLATAIELDCCEHCGFCAPGEAQVCEITWRLHGRANSRQVDHARVGITANTGLFGHRSAVVLSTSAGQVRQRQGRIRQCR